MRWADLDLLGHVNNVTYVDYLQEARVDLLRVHAPDARAADLAEGVLVVRNDITYSAPLMFRFGTVGIETWVTEIRAASFTLAYEIFDETPETPDGRRVYARASTVLTPYVFDRGAPRRLSDAEKEALGRVLEPPDRPAERPARPSAVESEVGHYPVHVRFSDVDVYRHVNNVTYVEYFQEGRVDLISRLAQQAGEGSHLRSVVARTEVEYVRPLTFRPAPYDLFTSVRRLGITSMVLESEIRDADVVCARARAVVVFWDTDLGRPVPPPPALREVLEARLAGE